MWATVSPLSEEDAVALAHEALALRDRFRVLTAAAFLQWLDRHR